MPQPDYDVAVLGGGPAGYAAALRAAQRGGRVCLIEADLLGGTCLNRGCIPTKAMLHAAKLAYDISRAGRLGLKVAKPSVDGPALMKRTGQVVSALRKGLSSLLDARKVEIVAGKGKLIAAETIEVATDNGPRQVKARSIILATGSRPAMPDRFGIEAGRRVGRIGVWVGDEKIAAIGVRVSRWVAAYHGLAVNADCDLAGFRHIIPCGIDGCRATSMARASGRDITVSQAKPALVESLCEALGVQAERIEPSELP